MNLPFVSIIVTTRNSAGTLGKCLESIRSQSYEAVELVVVDNDSSDGTKDIARFYEAEVVEKGPERSAQRNYGATQSSGDYILIVDSDMELSSDVVRECVEVIRGEESVKALVIPEESIASGFWARCKKLERSFYVGVDWMEAARFYERAAFIELGGYDETITGTEDHDLPMRVKSTYGDGSVSRISSLIYHNEQNLSLLESCRKKYYYGKTLDRYISRQSGTKDYRNRRSILKRFELYLSDPHRLFAEPSVGFGMLLMRLAEFLAMGAGLLQSIIRERLVGTR